MIIYFLDGTHENDSICQYNSDFAFFIKQSLRCSNKGAQQYNNLTFGKETFPNVSVENPSTW